MIHLKDEDMSRMIAGHISKRERKNFLKHLSECERCSKIFTEALKFFEEEGELKEVAAAPGFAERARASFWQVKKVIFKKPLLVTTLAAAIIILLIVPIFLQNSDDARWWTNKFGNYAKIRGESDSRVQRAFMVFERLKDVADEARARMPQLVIINTNGSGKPYALALPDGSIIINLETLEICYDVVDKKAGDSRLVIILGHEIAHLVQKDFTHSRAFLGHQEHGNKKIWEEDKERELQADKNGVLYAVMAGYDTSALFTKENNFLRRWVEQSGIGSYYDDDPQHPSMQKRVEFIRSQLKKVIENVELFRAGVIFLQMGDDHRGAAAFQGFKKFYPAREVYNNIGASYFNQAQYLIHQKFSHDYYRFRLSTTIDYSTGAEYLISMGSGDYLSDRGISWYISEAEKYFRLASGRDKHDRSSRLNHTAVLILKREYAGAVEGCDRLLKGDPQYVKALNNKSIALYYDGKERGLNNIGEAIQLLEKAAKIEPENVEVLYNLASLKQMSERSAAVNPYWEKYLKLPVVPRDNYYKNVYLKLKGKLPPVIKQAAELPEIPEGIRIGGNFSSIEKMWEKEQVLKYEYKLKIEYNLNNESVSILQIIVKDKVRILALDGEIEIVEEELSPFEEIDKNIEKFGPPSKIVHHTGGNFYIYKDKGFSIKEINGEAWSYIWFKPRDTGSR
jgi:tetratricopeptide (TPR) repeat protein